MNQYEVKAGLAEVDEFDVVGLSIVTNNTKAAEDINALWERFFKESTGQYVPDKVNDNIYAVYSDYEGDHEAPYRFTIGYPVTGGGGDGTPQSMHRITVQDQQYVIMSAAGQQPKALIETWEAIWSGDLPRSFTTDFELYGPRFFEDGINEVLVHIGIKNQ